MGESHSRTRFLRLLRRSPNRSAASLLVTGLLVGAGGPLAFGAIMHATSTEAFCTSCHAMAENPYQQLQNTTHYSNPSGVTATCSDCHVPQAFVPKMIRKLQASREVWSARPASTATPASGARPAWPT